MNRGRIISFARRSEEVDPGGSTAYAENVLIGRKAEVERLGTLLDQARLGRAGTLLIAGEAGLGKTSLLDATAAAAGDFRILRARGIESEGALSYAVILELLGGCRDPSRGTGYAVSAAGRSARRYSTV